MLAVVAFSTLLLFSLLGMIGIAYADGPFDPPGVGYLDFSYGVTISDPTEQKPESKLWWNDGFWWASLYNEVAGEYRIYRLNWGTQTWEDTGIALDDRPDSRADVLWDEANHKLYVASHEKKDNSGQVNGAENWARLYRFSYDQGSQSYSLDSGFPETVNEDRTEALVLAKDSNGRLWVTYVSRPQGTDDYQVYANASAGGNLSDDDNWGTPFTLTLNITPTAVHVAQDDISSIVAFKDDSPDDKIGIMWSNQLSGTLDFAYRNDDDALGAAWTHESISANGGSDDHINIKSLQTNSSGQVFAAVKTSSVISTATLIGMVARDTNGAISFHEYSTVADNDTRPILLIDEGDLGVPGDDQVYIFVTGKPGGSKICYKTADITAPLSNMSFPAEGCGTPFIEDDIVYYKIDNATSTKQNVNSTTGLVVLASDDWNEQVYVHNFLGDPPPVVTARGPERDETDVEVSAVVTATFSKPMNASTLNSSNFTVEDGSGPVAGSITYNSGTRTVTFTPDDLLQADTTYIVKLNDNVEDTTGKSLFGTGSVREEWSFTTAVTVQFSDSSYSVAEDGDMATITVTLTPASSETVEVDYTTSDGTAEAGVDYTAIPTTTLTFAPGETSKTFTVPIIDDDGAELDETVILTLSGPSNAALGTPASATLTILDNEGTPSVQYDSSSFNVGESDGSATIVVTLSHPDLVDPITVEYATSTSGSTATVGDDYTAIPTTTLTFAPGDTSESFTVEIVPDEEEEDAETVSLTLGNPSSNAVLGTPASATLTIVDDDAFFLYLPSILRNQAD
jgi:hypothetical protein